MDDLSIFKPLNMLYTEEDMSDYKPGGFHPVSLGDTFKDGRYEVHHKLGWGGFSTVWLAWDNISEIWVSLKVKSAQGSERNNEPELLRALQARGAQDHHIVQLLDDFVHEGPNGLHQCLVFELLGPCVDFVAYGLLDDEIFDTKGVLRVTTQMLARSFPTRQEISLNEADINGANLAFTSARLSRLSRAELFLILGEPEVDPLVRLDGQTLAPGLPKQLIKKADWIDWVDEDEEDIRIIDFGETFFYGARPEKLSQPGDLRIPETVFTDSFDHRIDLWRAGMTICTMLYGARPFMLWGGPETVIDQMIDFVEELPAEWAAEWAAKWEDMLKGAQWTLEHDIIAKSIRPRLDKRFHETIRKPALQCLLPIMRALIRFRPEDRISAKEALALIPPGWEDEESDDSSDEEMDSRVDMQSRL
ncbi:hypothetical protein VTL71DRAFT_2672 [Oculimacula yallundae]|uniref:non-specific serine/threonine protein kinase n=1 Tax=Oculimacula yallundae TaxID=86028 RepID=A0ABR4CBG2_9HELO